MSLNTNVAQNSPFGLMCKGRFSEVIIKVATVSRNISKRTSKGYTS